MAESTGQLDKLIEDKVNAKIKAFANDLTDQIRKFLKDNGDYSGDWLYQANGFKTSRSGGSKDPIDYKHQSVYDVYTNIKGGLELSIKDKMIATATKDLLAKVALLS
jgi:hypothetical protein